MKRSLKLLAALVAISLCRQTSAAIIPIANLNIAALKAAINICNANGQDDTIELAFFGTYTLTTVDNITNGSNGLPVILATSPISWSSTATARRFSAAPLSTRQNFAYFKSARAPMSPLTG